MALLLFTAGIFVAGFVGGYAWRARISYRRRHGI